MLLTAAECHDKPNRVPRRQDTIVLGHVAGGEEDQDDIQEEQGQEERPRTSDGGDGVDDGEDEPGPAVDAEGVVERGEDVALCVGVGLNRLDRIYLLDAIW